MLTTTGLPIPSTALLLQSTRIEACCASRRPHFRREHPSSRDALVSPLPDRLSKVETAGGGLEWRGPAVLPSDNERRAWTLETGGRLSFGTHGITRPLFCRSRRRNSTATIQTFKPMLVKRGKGTPQASSGRRTSSSASRLRKRQGVKRAARMATEKQFRANRENAKRSTGPKAPAGRARSSRNALRHG